MVGGEGMKAKRLYRACNGVGNTQTILCSVSGSEYRLQGIWRTHDGAYNTHYGWPWSWLGSVSEVVFAAMNQLGEYGWSCDRMAKSGSGPVRPAEKLVKHHRLLHKATGLAGTPPAAERYCLFHRWLTVLFAFPSPPARSFGCLLLSEGIGEIHSAASKTQPARVFVPSCVAKSIYFEHSFLPHMATVI